MRTYTVLQSNFYIYFRANLTPLVEATDELDLTLDIENQNGEKVGQLKAKVGWI